MTTPDTTMNAMTPEHLSCPPPWYRQFWPWALIAIPAVSVLLGLLMIALASGGHDALVVDDWYKEGKSINRRIERDAEAARLGLLARLARVPGGLALELSAAERTFAPPPALAVRWVHVTRAERDGGTTFEHVGGGRYVAAGAALPEDGRWRVHVEPQLADWRLVSDTLTLRKGSEPRIASVATEAAR